MKTLLRTTGLVAAVQIWSAAAAFAGPWEEGMAAYNRGDYVPAVQFVLPLAQAGNAKAQALLGGMYRRGEGVARSTAIAFMWLTLAARRGDPKARADLRTVSRSMTAEERAQARAMMQACEASNYRIAASTVPSRTEAGESSAAHDWLCDCHCPGRPACSTRTFTASVSEPPP